MSIGMREWRMSVKPNDSWYDTVNFLPGGVPRNGTECPNSRFPQLCVGLFRFPPRELVASASPSVKCLLFSGRLPVAKHFRMSALGTTCSFRLVIHSTRRAYNPSPRFRPKPQSIPPSLRATPETWRPSCFSSDGDQGTNWNPRPSSIMANRPEASAKRCR